jgi:hypothetical protein
MARKKKVEKSLVVENVSNGGPPSSEPADSTTSLWISGKAIEWARECGLQGEIVVQSVDLVRYPRHGHGYFAHVRETDGRARSATARFDCNGNRSYWSVDGNVVV